MFALEEVVVVFIVNLASWASVVVAWTAIVKAFSDWEFAPAEFRKEGTGTGILGVDGTKVVPVDKVECGLRPEKPFAVVISKGGKMDMGSDCGVEVAGDGYTVYGEQDTSRWIKGNVGKGPAE